MPIATRMIILWDVYTYNQQCLHHCISSCAKFKNQFIKENFLVSCLISQCFCMVFVNLTCRNVLQHAQKSGMRLKKKSTEVYIRPAESTAESAVQHVQGPVPGPSHQYCLMASCSTLGYDTTHAWT